MHDDGSWRLTAVKALLNPQSIAVVGANPTSPRRSVFLDNLRASAFAGRAYGINPRWIDADENGYSYFQSLDALPEVPDVVLAAVGSHSVPAIVSSAASLGVKATIVYDGGFADFGSDGRLKQLEIARVANEAHMGLVGPNCYGLVNVIDRIPLYALPVRYPESAGGFGLVSASGGIVDSIVGDSQGARWGFVATTGNEAVLNVADYIAAWATDPRCTGIATFIETVRDPEAFFAALDLAASAGKPVVVLRVGRSEASRQAALAHTGALALPARLFDARLKAHGAVVVDSIPELLSTVSLLQSGRRAGGPGVAFVSGSGGLNELAVEAIAGTSVVLSALGGPTKSALARVLGPYIRIENPLDWYPSDPTNLNVVVDAVVNDPAIDCAMLLSHFNFKGLTGDPEYAGLGVDEAIEIATRSDKPLMVVDAGTVPDHDVERASMAGVVVVGGIDNAVKSLANLINWSAAQRLFGQPKQVESVEARSSPIPRSGIAALGLVAEFLPVSTTLSADSADDAVTAARSLRFPVAVKVGDEAVLHKTEIGGVRLGLADECDVREAAKELLGSGAQQVLVQEQLTGGVELICGVQFDAVLGGFLMIGLGGVWAEIFDDVALRPLGVMASDVEAMLRELKAFPLLDGARGRPKVDIDALTLAILGIDRLARAVASQVSAIDVNPLIATPGGAFAVDAVFVPAQTAD